MFKSLLFNILLCILAFNLNAQSKYFSRSGNISFFSEAPVENIEAHNKKATSVIDFESGRMEFAVLIKAFQFEKALMQEHFNENYMESSKYPKAVFKGQIENVEKIVLTADGDYPVTVKGDITIRGITKPVETQGKIKITDGAVSAVSSFELTVADFDIKIPKVVRENIAKIVRVDVNVDYQKLDKKS